MADIKEWVNEQRSKGFTDDQLKEHLKQSGHSESDINEAFSSETPQQPAIPSEQTNSPPPTPEQPISVPEPVIPKKSKNANFILLGVILLLAVGAIIYLNMGGIINCSDEACFQENILSCNKAVFVQEQGNSKSRQTILGGDSNFCSVKTEVLADSNEAVVGLSMTCKIPLNLDVMPSSFLDFECEGELWEYTKEQMDALIGGMADNLPEGMTDNLTDMMDDVLDGDLPDGFPSLNFP